MFDGTYVKNFTFPKIVFFLLTFYILDFTTYGLMLSETSKVRLNRTEKKNEAKAKLQK